MTTPLNPLDREAWEKLVDAHARAVIDYNSKDGRFRFGELQEARDELITQFAALRSQLTEARAEVERMKRALSEVGSVELFEDGLSADLEDTTIGEAYMLGRTNAISELKEEFEKARQPK